jgi:hypothetical protein
MLYIISILDIAGNVVDDSWTSFFAAKDYDNAADALAAANADYDDAVTWAAKGGYTADMIAVSAGSAA